MDFARKQLEKYGWTDGKGLGKNENGIAQALKPKLKRSVTGIGHDAASDFTEHWWTQLYNKAAGNVEVEEKDGKTKKIKTKDTDDFEITNSTWKIKKKKKKTDKEEQYADFFIRKAVLTNGGSRTMKMEDDGSESDGEGAVKKDMLKMTDEELFAACEGRTAHKGARHGLKATGKLARIAQQEQLLLKQPQYEGYSHVKRQKAEEKVLENTEDNENGSNIPISNSKKQKMKNKGNRTELAESVMSLPINCEKKTLDSVVSNNENYYSGRKMKKSKNKQGETAVMLIEENDTGSNKKQKKHKCVSTDCNSDVANVDNNEVSEIIVKKFKKKKLKNLNSLSE